MSLLLLLWLLLFLLLVGLGRALTHGLTSYRCSRWDEMAYDIQAGIDFILQETGQQRLSFVGHSLGCALFFIAMIQEPQLNEKIDVMFALGSATNLNHFTGTMKRLANVWKLVLKLRFLFQNGPFIDHPRGITNKLQKEICTRSLLGAKLCRNYLFTIFGFSNLNNFNLVRSLSTTENISPK